MYESVACPKCKAAWRVISSRMNQSHHCKCCGCVFRWISTAVKSDAPLPMMKNAEDDKLRDQPIRIQLPGKLQGTWCAMAARLTLAANVAAFLMPIGYVAYDRVLHQWIGPAIYFRFESGRPRQTSMLEAHAEFWILATIWPAV